MTLDGEAERLAYELAKLTGQPVEQAVMKALRDELAPAKGCAAAGGSQDHSEVSSGCRSAK